MRLTGTECVPLQRPSSDTKAWAKAYQKEALPKGEGALPHNLSPALVEPPFVAEVLSRFDHAFAHAGLLPQLVALTASPSSW